MNISTDLFMHKTLVFTSNYHLTLPFYLFLPQHSYTQTTTHLHLGKWIVEIQLSSYYFLRSLSFSLIYTHEHIYTQRKKGWRLNGSRLSFFLIFTVPYFYSAPFYFYFSTIISFIKLIKLFSFHEKIVEKRNKIFMLHI